MTIRRATQRSCGGAAFVLAMAWGVLTAAPLLLASDWIALATLIVWPWHDSLARAFFNAAIPEETIKLVGMVAALWCITKLQPKTSRRRELAAGLAVGLGFALVESFVQVADVSARHDGQTGLLVAVLRMHTALPLHAGLGVLAACYWTMGAYGRAWLIPVILHGLYDLAIFEAARPGGGFFHLALGYLVLALLIWWVVRLYPWAATAPAPGDSGRFSPL